MCQISTGTVIFSILALIDLYSQQTSGSLCGPFYDDTKHNVINPLSGNKRIVVLNVGKNPVSFNVANEICRKCIDGHLVMKDHIDNIIDYLPTWVGIQSRYNPVTDTVEWLWVDGQPVQDYFFFRLKNFFAPPKSSHRPDTHFGVYALKSRYYFAFNQSVDWVALPFDQLGLPVNDSQVSLIHLGATVNTTNRIAGPHIYQLVCERSVRTSCHYWNFTEHPCNASKNFRCHNFVNFMVQHPDEIGGNREVVCRRPTSRRKAVKCPASSCTCATTPWSQWSPCGSETCSDVPANRFRNRDLLPNCPDTYERPKLMENESCEIEGCDDIRVQAEGEDESIGDKFDPSAPQQVQQQMFAGLAPPTPRTMIRWQDSYVAPNYETLDLQQ